MREFEENLYSYGLGESTTRLLRLAQSVAIEHKDLYLIKGPGIGDRSTAAYIHDLHGRVDAESEGAPDSMIRREETLVENESGARVDFWIPTEETIIEIALGLRNPLSEFERDVLKAVIARDAGVPVSTLVLIGKPLTLKRMSAPWCKQVINWAATRGLRVCVFELVKKDNDA